MAMRDVMLIIHFIGLAMGLGTSLAFMFLGIASSKMEKSEAIQFTIRSFPLSKMGHIGLTLLVVSGIYLMTPFWGGLSEMPLLITKLVLVVILGGLIGMISGHARKAQAGNAETHLQKIAPLGKVSLLVSLAIVVLAVLIFH